MNSIPLHQTNLFSPLVLDYLKGKEALKELYAHTPDLRSFDHAIKLRSKQTVDRKTLHGVLIKQFNDCAVKPNNTKQHIDSLLNENTYTVCTGHQLCLLTGPLYVIYKIVTTINLAKQLKQQYPDNNFIPVLWLASEDHDFNEANHVHLFGNKIIWDEEHGNGRGAVGKLSTQGIDTFLSEVYTVLGDSENAKKIKQLIKESYSENKTFSQAFRHFITVLFAEYGLVVLDADDKQLKVLFKNAITEDIFKRPAEALLHKANEILKKNNYPTQINARAINFFYMQDGKRDRIEFADGKYKVLNNSVSFTEQELKTEIDNHPERFSPNVVMRPVYQEAILPNLAYIGGPGEVAYWVQLKPVFDHHKIAYPVIVLRNSALLVDEDQLKRIEKLSLTISDFFNDTDSVIFKFLKINSSDSFSTVEGQGSLTNLYKQLAAEIEKVDATLKPAVEAELQKVLNGLQAIEGKVNRSLKAKHETALSQIKKLKEKLFPNGEPQERVDNFLQYYLKKGEVFIPQLINELNPMDNSFKIISL